MHNLIKNITCNRKMACGEILTSHQLQRSFSFLHKKNSTQSLSSNYTRHHAIVQYLFPTWVIHTQKLYLFHFIVKFSCNYDIATYSVKVNHNNLKPSQQCVEAFSKARSVLGWINNISVYLARMSSRYFTRHTSGHTWNSVLKLGVHISKKNIKCLEKIQQRATKMVHGLKDITGWTVVQAMC